MNTLLNPGFEGGTWRKTHTGQEYGEISVPQDWVAFWKEGLPVPHDPGNTVGYARPEMKVIDKAPPFLDPPRIHSGNRAVLMFTFYKIHDGGLYQQVAVVPGQRLFFSAWAHAWSSQRDDPRQSDLATEDDRRNFTFAVGIDPTGATDPWSASVVWGAPVHIYDAYAPIPVVETIAQAQTITVFIRSQVLWPFKHCDAYFDTAILDMYSPEPPECPGLPRVDYPRTYNVIPANTTEDRAVEIFREGWRRGKETAGGSYDDAMMGALFSKLARLYDIPEAQRCDFVDFRDTYYPDAPLEFAGESPTPPPPPPPFVLSQRDPVWRDRRFGATTCTLTIGQAGCYITAIAEAQRFYAIGSDATPVTVDVTATPAGYTNCLLTWAAIIARLGMDITSNGDLNAHLDSGKVALLRVLPSSPEHFVLAIRRAGSDYVIRDPWYGTEELLSARYTGIHSFRLLAPKTAPPPPPPPPVTPIRPTGTRGQISLHWTPTTQAGVQNFVQTIRPPSVKLTTAGGDGDRLAMIRGWSPNTLLVHRRVENDLDRYNPATAAPYVQRYITDLSPHFNLSDFSKPPLYVVSINEIYECGATANNIAAVNWDIAFMNAVEATGLNLRAVVYTAPVGNPEPNTVDLEPLLPMVAKAVAGKHLLGKHCYYASVPSQPSFYRESWNWYGGRFALDDAFFVSRGLRPYWMIGEGGACEATLHPGGIVTLNPGAGWKACGSIQRYAAELVWANQWYTNWNAVHNGRLLNVSLFTTGGWGWDLFDLQGADLDVVTNALVTIL